MPHFVKCLRAFGIVAGVIVFFLVLSTFSGRHSLFFWAILSSLLLPVAFWFRMAFKKWCLSMLVVALGLSMSPVDITVMRLERPGLRLLPISYGIGCQPGTACYGCIVPPNPARKAVVISY